MFASRSNLSTYLHDHCAGARFAIEAMNRLAKSYDAGAFPEFLRRLSSEIEEDFAVLQQIIGELSGDGSTLKEAASWLAERASRLKLLLINDAEFAAFELLEFLSLGVLGKQKLWQVLQLLASDIDALQGIDYATLIPRAQSQHDELEQWRQTFATRAFGGAKSKEGLS